MTSKTATATAKPSAEARVELQRKRNATARNRAGTYELSKEARATLADLLVLMSKYEQKIELKRQYLATNENFEPYSAF